MEPLPGNSHRSQQQPAPEQKKIEKVVQGEVTARKQSWRKRFSAAMIANRADTVGEHVFWNVLVPAAKNTIADVGISFINQMMFGTGNQGRAQSIVGGMISQTVGQYGNNQVNYNRIGNPMPGMAPPQPVISHRGRALHDFKEILIPTRVEAEEVINQLLFRIREYNAVTVSDFYELCGITPDYTDDKFGWTDIRGAGVVPTRNGQYVIDLPRPTELD